VFAWLNRNAAAVQAIASIASALTTIALAWITFRYVTLTGELARAAREQLRMKQQSAASEAAQLLTLIDVLIGSLGKLPGDEEHAEAIRDVPIWKHADIATLTSLTAAVVGTGTRVHDAIQRLNWIRGKVEQVQQTAPGRYPWDDFPFDEWRRELTAARASLGALRKEVVATQSAA
jgi:hypothetical protein